MYDYKVTDLMVKSEIKVNNGYVTLRVPQVKEIIDNKQFESYVSVFTLVTRQLFAAYREVDELEDAFPTSWHMLWNEQMNVQIGGIYGEGKKLTDVMLESLSFWSGFPIKELDDKGDEKGFMILKNQQKILHIGTEWVIDYEEFISISRFIKTVTSWQYPEDDVPQRPMTDGVYASWMNFYKGKQETNKKRKKTDTMANAILALSVSMESYLPIDEIIEMNLFVFYKTIEFLEKKDAYDTQWRVFSLDNIDRSKVPQPKKHWKQEAKIIID